MAGMIGASWPSKRTEGSWPSSLAALTMVSADRFACAAADSALAVSPACFSIFSSST